MEHYYTNERNAQIVISLLKAHEIKKIIVSPGMTNICLVASLQQDPFFEIYSAADERSAGYIACGLAAESGEPVVLSCTGATASRNYMPAMTEAYYRKLPILAITSSRSSHQIGHNIDQVTDRTAPPNDVAKISVQLPLIYNEEAEWGCMIAANKAILELHHHGKGPVHINLETGYSRDYTVKELPATNAIFRFGYGDDFPEIKAKKIAIVVGAHVEWSAELTEAVDAFCATYNGVVLCDHTSNYKGKYRILANLVAQQQDYISAFQRTELLIHIGDVSASKYNVLAKEVWRINPDGALRDPYKKLHYVFEMEEVYFFKQYVKNVEKAIHNEFYNTCSAESEQLTNKMREITQALPFSNIWMASQTSIKLPQNSILHLGIQNSLRSWNFFEIPHSVLGYSNTGGYGIDGCLSSAVGASLANTEKICFCVLGDLAFFYDMNSLGNRHIGSNVRILLVNNGIGSEFKISTCPGAMFGEMTDDFIAAAGHYGNKSTELVKHYAEDLGFEYLTASSKEEYIKVVEHFVSPEMTDRPMILEAFTDDADEDAALHMLRTIMSSSDANKRRTAKDAVKGLLGEQGVKAVKKILGR